jgi:hypothetical protein
MNTGVKPYMIYFMEELSSVFVNHFYRPDMNEITTKRIRPVLDELRSELLILDDFS